MRNAGLTLLHDPVDGVCRYCGVTVGATNGPCDGPAPAPGVDRDALERVLTILSGSEDGTPYSERVREAWRFIVEHLREQGSTDGYTLRYREGPKEGKQLSGHHNGGENAAP